MYYTKTISAVGFEHIDGDNDDLLNRIIWNATKGNQRYPEKFVGKDKND